MLKHGSIDVQKCLNQDEYWHSKIFARSNGKLYKCMQY